MRDKPQANDLDEVQGEPHTRRNDDAFPGFETQSGSQPGSIKHRGNQKKGREPLEGAPDVISASANNAAVARVKNTGDPP